MQVIHDLWDGYLQPLELLTAEEALASSLEQEHLLGYQLVTLLLQSGDDPWLQENLTASKRGYTPPGQCLKPAHSQQDVFQANTRQPPPRPAGDQRSLDWPGPVSVTTAAARNAGLEGNSSPTCPNPQRAWLPHAVKAPKVALAPASLGIFMQRQEGPVSRLCPEPSSRMAAYPGEHFPPAPPSPTPGHH